MKHVLAVFLPLTLSLAAQPAVPRPSVPVPGGAPSARAEGAQNNARAQNGDIGEIDPNALAVGKGIPIEGTNWDDLDIANAYTKYTGKRVLLSSATQNLEMRFLQYGPLTNAEAARLIDKVLNMEGYAFIPSGVNEVKLLPKAQGAGPNAPGDIESMIHDPNEIPEGDEFISYFMKLSYIKPEEAVRTFTQSIHGLGPGAKIAPVPNASALIISGKSSFVRKLINQREYIDVAAGNIEKKWITMVYADAEEVATSLNELMNSQQQRQTTAGVITGGNRANNANRANTPPVPGNNNAAATGVAATSAGEDIPVQIISNSRLNKILIVGRPIDILFVEDLAHEFDAPPNRNTFVKRRLRFMLPSDFLEVAANALETVGGTVGGVAGNQQGGAAGGRTNTGNNNQNNNNQATTGSGTAAESVQEFEVSDVPESRVIGKTLLVANNLANTILVQGPPESIRIVSELIDQLDGRPMQVQISTVFGQITLGSGRDLGISYGAIANGDGDGVAGNVDNGVGDLLGLGALTDVAGLNAVSSAGLNIYGAVDNLSATLRALQTRSDFKVLSRPTVYTSNNRRAIISSGRRIAVPTNTFTSGATTGATQSTNIEFRDVLLRFEVVPLINSEDELTLRISLLNEDTQGVQIIDGNEIPTIVTESIATTVTVYNKKTVVLGGLVTETESNTTSGVPVLSNIPALGRLFRREEKNVDRRELLIFIQPTIVTGDQSQRAAQADLGRHYRREAEVYDFAAGVLPAKPKTTSKAKTKKATNATPAATQDTSSSKKKRLGLRFPTRR